MEEKWKDIEGYEGLYQVSNTGLIRNVLTKTILKQNPDQKGYLLIQLSKEGRRKTHKMHRLIAQSFIRNPMNKPQVNHIDEDVTNNRVENLEWVTNSENQLHGNRNRRNANKLSKPVVATNIRTGEKIIFPSVSSTLQFGFSPSKVSESVNGIKENHKGFEWEFADIELNRKIIKVVEGATHD